MILLACSNGSITARGYVLIWSLGHGSLRFEMEQMDVTWWYANCSSSIILNWILKKNEQVLWFSASRAMKHGMLNQVDRFSYMQIFQENPHNSNVCRRKTAVRSQISTPASFSASTGDGDPNHLQKVPGFASWKCLLYRWLIKQIFV